MSTGIISFTKASNDSQREKKRFFLFVFMNTRLSSLGRFLFIYGYCRIFAMNVVIFPVGSSVDATAEWFDFLWDAKTRFRYRALTSFAIVELSWLILAELFVC